VAVPEEASIVVVDSGERRALVGSAYAERRRQCEEAARRIGPLRGATLADVASLDEGVIRRRAHHVVSENVRVTAFAEALRSGDLAAAGALMHESHVSLRDDFEVSTPGLDRLVAGLLGAPGVRGARLTGAGFGGCVVALADPDARVDGWRFRPAGGATVSTRA
jgi:galactokinase